MDVAAYEKIYKLTEQISDPINFILMLFFNVCDVLEHARSCLDDPDMDHEELQMFVDEVQQPLGVPIELQGRIQVTLPLGDLL